MDWKKVDKKPDRQFRMFKRRVRKLDIYEEAKRKNRRTWNTVDE